MTNFLAKGSLLGVLFIALFLVVGCQKDNSLSEINPAAVSTTSDQLAIDVQQAEVKKAKNMRQAVGERIFKTLPEEVQQKVVADDSFAAMNSSSCRRGCLLELQSCWQVCNAGIDDPLCFAICFEAYEGCVNACP